jgi:hypothetical protein
MRTNEPLPTRDLEAALRQLDSVTRDGLRHGFFKYEVHCEKIKAGKRQLTIFAGKSYRFTISEDELAQ